MQISINDPLIDRSQFNIFLDLVTISILLYDDCYLGMSFQH